MFTEKFEMTALTTDAANYSGVFSRISGDELQFGDSTAMSTLRALVYPRMAENDELNFALDTILLKSGELQASAHIILDNVLPKTNSLTVYNVRQCTVDANELFSLVSQVLPNRYDGYVLSKKITHFLKAQFPAVVFINEKDRSTIILGEEIDLPRWRRLQSVFLISLPWFYRGQKLTALENELLSSLSEPTGVEYVKTVEKIAAQYDFEEIYMEKMVSKFHQRNRIMQIDAKKEESTKLLTEIQHLSEMIRQKIAERENVEILLGGLQAALLNDDNKDEMLLDYLRSNKSIEVEKTDEDDSIGFIVRGVFEYYDMEMMETHLRSWPSYLYDVKNGFTKEDMKRFLRAVFVDEIMHINTIACYRYRYSNTNVSVSAIGRYNFKNAQFYLPNPHIQYYRCMGRYESLIDQALATGDLITAIEQTVASTRSINFGDSTVMSQFIQDLCTKRNPFVVMPNGENATVRAAIEWLKAEDAKKAKEN